jgi:hypothetical protein
VALALGCIYLALQKLMVVKYGRKITGNLDNMVLLFTSVYRWFGFINPFGASSSEGASEIVCIAGFHATIKPS